MARAKRSGRRSGKPDTRSEILSAARTLFAAEGFESVSMRRIASAAGVDPSLIHHYFGSKDDLFMASIELPVDPGVEIEAALKGNDIEGAGARLMRAFAAIWDGPHHDKMIAAVRTMLSKPGITLGMKHIFQHRIVATIERTLGDQIDHVNLRANFVATQVFGLVVVRYILRLEPLTSMTVDELAETIGPTIDRYLTMPVEHLER